MKLFMIHHLCETRHQLIPDHHSIASTFKHFDDDDELRSALWNEAFWPNIETDNPECHRNHQKIHPIALAYRRFASYFHRHRTENAGNRSRSFPEDAQKFDRHHHNVIPRRHFRSHHIGVLLKKKKTHSDDFHYHFLTRYYLFPSYHR